MNNVDKLSELFSIKKPQFYVKLRFFWLLTKREFNKELFIFNGLN